MRAIRINPADNVAVALDALSAGESFYGVTLAEDIPAGHKFTLRDLASGDNVIKYGFPTGHLTRAAAAGTLVDHSCIATNLSGLSDYEYHPADVSAGGLFGTRGPNHPRSDSGGTAGAAGGGMSAKREVLGSKQPAGTDSFYDIPASDYGSGAGTMQTFDGFRREDGQVGVRNNIWIIPTVGCVAGVAETLAKRFGDEIAGDPGSVDAVVAFPHNYGCSQLGDDHENTRVILADLVRHPNAGGVLVVGLGCENNQPESFMELVGGINPDRVKIMVTQKVRGDEVECGLALLRQIFAACREDKRIPVPVSELRIGLKCGGSDGLSGITANPLLGVFSDRLCACGGTTVLTEVPEMFGAETLLMDRCVSREVFDRTVAMINGFKNYFISQGQPVYENPSPGNKAGGISTLEEKSLGCTQKSGSSPVMDVLEYGGRLSVRGLNLLSAPGNDLVASTALAAAGCQIVLFTTGRGTPFGSPVPTVKVSTNSALAAAKPGWIDFNAGVLAEDRSMEEVEPEFWNFVLEVASGVRTRNEANGWTEMSIFKSGVTL